jgi:hypothetical protein
MTTRPDPFDPSTAIYTPAEVSTYAKDQIEWMHNNQHRAIQFFIPGISDYFAPLLPGQVCAVIAQTSNYKSGFLHAWERAVAEQLTREGRTDEVVVHVSVEESVEEQAFLLFSQEIGEDAGDIARGTVQDWGRLQQAAIRIGSIPIYRIGDSLARAEDFPKLHLSNMLKSIKYLQDNLLDRKLKIAALFFDYLQAFPFDDEHKVMGDKDNQRRLQVRQDIYRLRYAAAYFNCPAIVAVQAKQHLDGAPSQNFYVPGQYDGEESASIAQRCDRIMSLWMPKQTHSLGTVVDYKNISFTVEENLLWLKVCKQRGRLPAGRSWPCRIDFNQNRILVEE